MGKPTGFLDYKRVVSKDVPPAQRIKNFNEFHVHLSLKDQQLQGARCMDCGVPYCQYGGMIAGMASGCPLNNLIPEWNDLVYRGNYKEAYKRLHKTSSFPEFTSRVCPALCENACTCSLHGDAVATKENEYAIIEYAFANGLVQAKPPKNRTGKRVAVVGSGPAGMACADALNKRGHHVTVFEREDRPGGLLMYGIPNMKLEKDVVLRRTKLMEGEGVTFRCGVNVGKDISAKQLEQDYDAVVLCCGAKKPRDISAPGRDAQGIYFAVDFLSKNTKSLLDSDFKDHAYVECRDKAVIVIGGGDTGNDCVGTAIRHGAKSVMQIEMMPKPPVTRRENNPWPEWPRVLKTDYGQEEAIEVYGHDPRIYESTVSEFVKDDKGNLKAVKVVSLKWENGKMELIPESVREYPADLVLIAAGFLGSEAYVTKAFSVETDSRTNIKTQGDTFETSVSNVFAAGDVRRGQSLVVWAIREGRDAARAVDIKLMGYSNI